MKKKYILYSSILGVIAAGFIVFVGANYLTYQNDIQQKVKKLDTTENIGDAYFAGGCFWCVESGFEKYKEQSVIDVISGYAGGTVENPTYKEVGLGTTGHRESVRVIYDTTKISYNDLLEIFVRLINPTDNGGQYVDRGFPYTSAIFYHTEQEKKMAESSMKQLEKSGRYGDKNIVTSIIPYANFYEAEDYHQDFYIKNPIRYNVYTNGSGRKEYLESIWGEDIHYNISIK